MSHIPGVTNLSPKPPRHLLAPAWEHLSPIMRPSGDAPGPFAIWPMWDGHALPSLYKPGGFGITNIFPQPYSANSGSQITPWMFHDEMGGGLDLSGNTGGGEPYGYKLLDNGGEFETRNLTLALVVTFPATWKDSPLIVFDGGPTFKMHWSGPSQIRTLWNGSSLNVVTPSGPLQGLTRLIVATYNLDTAAATVRIGKFSNEVDTNVASGPHPLQGSGRFLGLGIGKRKGFGWYRDASFAGNVHYVGVWGWAFENPTGSNPTDGLWALLARDLWAHLYPEDRSRSLAVPPFVDFFPRAFSFLRGTDSIHINCVDGCTLLHTVPDDSVKLDSVNSGAVVEGAAAPKIVLS